MQSNSLRARHHRAQCSTYHIPKTHIRVYAPNQILSARRRLLSCSAAADANILQDQSPQSAQGQQQGADQAVQQPQRVQQQQQQLQDGLLGPLTTPTAAAEGDDPQFEADRVVERELLDSNGA